MKNRTSRYCWVCGRYFEAKRETAFLCSARCRQWRSRFAKLHGRWPNRLQREVAPWHCSTAAQSLMTFKLIGKRELPCL